MKWDYERVASLIDGTCFLYIDGFISFEEKERLQKEIYEKSGWTYDEFMEECERRIG